MAGRSPITDHWRARWPGQHDAGPVAPLGHRFLIKRRAGHGFTPNDGLSCQDEFEATIDASFAQRFQSIRARNQAADASWWRVIMLAVLSPPPAHCTRGAPRLS